MFRKLFVFLLFLGLLATGVIPSQVGAQEPDRVVVPIHPDPPYNGGEYTATTADELMVRTGWGACVPDEPYRPGQFWATYDPFEEFRARFMLIWFRLENVDTGEVLIDNGIWWDTGDYWRSDLFIQREYDHCYDPAWEYWVIVWEYPLDLDSGTYLLSMYPYVRGALTDFADTNEDGRIDVFHGFWWRRWHPEAGFPYTATIHVVESEPTD